MPSFKTASHIAILVSWFATAFIYAMKAEEVAALKHEVHFIHALLKKARAKKVCACGELQLSNEAKDKVIQSLQNDILHLEKLMLVCEEEEIDCVNLHYKIIEIESECGL